MMRFGRRTSLLVVFTLLALATTAHAECAWVLWEESTILSATADTFEWKILKTGSAEKACAEAVAAQVRATLAFWQSPERQPPGLRADAKPTRKIDVSSNQVLVHSAGSSYGYRFLCLPDTVDPRGPKGK